MKNYHYNVEIAIREYHERINPLTKMKELGFKVIKAEPIPLFDCWWFQVDNDIDVLPDYITPLPNNLKFHNS